MAKFESNITSDIPLLLGPNPCYGDILYTCSNRANYSIFLKLDEKFWLCSSLKTKFVQHGGNFHISEGNFK